MSRVLMTADAVGGVWTYALELARALTRRGVSTVLATMGPRPSRDQMAAAAKIAGLEVEPSDFALEWMDDPWRDVRAAGDWLLRLEAYVRPIVVHLNGFAHGALPFRAPVLVVGHSCVVSWDEAVGGACDRTALGAYRQVVGGGLRAASWVVAPSRAMLNALQKHYGPLERTSVIPNGRDPSRFGGAPKAPFVFTAGRLWDRAKNVDAVRAVAPRLSWPVMLAGDAAMPAATQASTSNSAESATSASGSSDDASREAPSRVGYLGRLSELEIRAWLARASIVALPARYEPFGLLALEAALSECALVLGDIPSLREVWGDAAVYVDPDDRDELRRAIDALIADPRLLRERARAARLRAATYTPDLMADRYLDLYRLLQTIAGPRTALPDAPGAMRCAS